MADLFKEKIKELTIELNKIDTSNSQIKQRPVGCPMKAMMDSRLTNAFPNQKQLHKAFMFGLIGNNRHEGTVINNCKDVSEYFNS